MAETVIWRHLGELDALTKSNAWQNKHTYSKMACLLSYPWQEQIHRMYETTTTNLAKLNIMLRICQKYFIAKVEQDWVMLGHSIIARAWMDQLQQYLQNILTEHLQKEHGSLCRHMDTKQQNNSSHRLSKITKSPKSETLRSLLWMLVLVTTEITKIRGIHPWKYGMTYNKSRVELMPIRCTHQMQQT